MHAATESYLEVRRLIHDTVHRFRASHGGDHDELVAEANYHFMRAYRATVAHARRPDNRVTAAFPTWVRHKVWWGLLDTARRKAQQNARLARVEATLTEMPHYYRFDAVAFAAELSEDAAAVVHLAIDQPSARGIKTSIARALAAQGWDDNRIDASLTEIRNALFDGRLS